MKSFLLRLTIFFIPLLLGLLGVELLIRNSLSSFRLKAKYFREKEQIDVLILGASHTQNGINPRYFQCIAANLGNGNQDLKLDLQLLKKAIELNKKPKVVLLEIAYSRLLYKTPSPYWRNALYENFYDLDLPDVGFLSKYILVTSNSKFFRNYILERSARKQDDSQFNQWGYNENDFQGVFRDLGYDSSRIATSAPKRLLIDDWKDPNKKTIDDNIDYLNEMISICGKNNITLCLFAAPVFRTHSAFFKTKHTDLRNQTIVDLQKHHGPLKWMNFEDSPIFDIKHFKNDDHLNADGAVLLTKMLNDSLHVLCVQP